MDTQYLLVIALTSVTKIPISMQEKYDPYLAWVKADSSAKLSAKEIVNNLALFWFSFFQYSWHLEFQEYLII